ncbi:hypothetical protein JRO89_XSUnG0178400 [Xanthoceras sorbifolium]|uniref:Zinc finger, CCHC-type n=1 Tax=Xanthoceras sorbifolium TaxID=99658 RepID=A0ABQ8GXH9_9ROSI|nr:hypothetical protein JRO89_XSUnG0178400 [Xanthoceras sorbifolium]
MEVDSGLSRDCLGKYLRVRILVDIGKPLKRYLRVDILGDGMETIMLLKYDSLTLFCFNCDYLGHTVREYVKETKRVHQAGTCSFKFGSWLRAEANQSRLVKVFEEMCLLLLAETDRFHNPWWQEMLGLLATNSMESVDEKGMSSIELHLSDELISNVMEENSAKGTWEKLEKFYTEKSLSNKLILKDQLYWLKMEEDRDIMAHLKDFNLCISDLIQVNVKYEEDNKALLLLRSLSDSFKHFKNTLLFGKDTLKSDAVVSDIISYEFKLYDMANKKTILSKDVVFDEASILKEEVNKNDGEKRVATKIPINTKFIDIGNEEVQLEEIQKEEVLEKPRSLAQGRPMRVKTATTIKAMVEEMKSLTKELCLGVGS